MTFEPRTNPWNLPAAVQRVCHLLIELESNKLVARELGVAVKTVEAAIAYAKKSMKARGRIGVAVGWDRFTRSMQK